MLRRFYGVRDPWELTPLQWLRLLDRIGDLTEAEAGVVDHRSRVQKMMREKTRKDEW